jgi:pimeloyl-ACP methyl ester carboxylesterase
VQVAARLAKLTRVCWYDRAGYGWSDPGPAPRDSVAIARDLHAILAGAGVPPPYVLVGAGSGGFYVRVFSGLFRREVAGMVLVDAAHEDEARLMPWIKGPVPDFLKPAQSTFAQVAGEVGLSRLFENRSARQESRPQGFTAAEWATISALRHQSKRYPSLAKELAAYNRSAEEARAAGGLGALPLIVLTSGGFNRFPDRERVRLELQQQLARLSTRGKLVEIHAQFALQYTATNAVADAVHDVLIDSRRR